MGRTHVIGPLSTEEVTDIRQGKGSKQKVMGKIAIKGQGVETRKGGGKRPCAHSTSGGRALRPQHNEITISDEW